MLLQFWAVFICTLVFSMNSASSNSDFRFCEVMSLGSGSVVMLVFVPPAESSVSMILFILSTVVCVFISCFTLIDTFLMCLVSTSYFLYVLTFESPDIAQYVVLSQPSKGSLSFESAYVPDAWVLSLPCYDTCIGVLDVWSVFWSLIREKFKKCILGKLLKVISPCRIGGWIKQVIAQERSPFTCILIPESVRHVVI